MHIKLFIVVFHNNKYVFDKFRCADVSLLDQPRKDIG